MRVLRKVSRFSLLCRLLVFVRRAHRNAVDTAGRGRTSKIARRRRLMGRDVRFGFCWRVRWVALVVPVV
jgi:hypothetical protein